MASKLVGICKSLFAGGTLLLIFGWLAFLTVHHIRNEEAKMQGERGGRQKRAAGTHNSPNVGGAIYVRWGRTECPSDAELVYKGIAGGGHYTHGGGGSDYVCLTEDPKYANTKPGAQANAVIYGAELQVSGINLFDTSNANPMNLHNSDVQCAVCRTPTRPSMVMIPGTNICPQSGWNKEYWGYLMTAHYGHTAQHNFVCVDHAPSRGTEGGNSRDDNGAMMYHVEGRCGSLPCQPYKHGDELTCVVCTK